MVHIIKQELNDKGRYIIFNPETQHWLYQNTTNGKKFMHDNNIKRQVIKQYPTDYIEIDEKFKYNDSTQNYIPKIFLIKPDISNYDANDIFIGSTTESLCNRLSYYKKRSNTRLKYHSAVKLIYDKYGTDNIKIELLELLQNVTELKSRLRYWIQNIKCLNKKIPTVEMTKDEIYELHKKYRQQHKKRQEFKTILEAYHKSIEHDKIIDGYAEKIKVMTLNIKDLENS